MKVFLSHNSADKPFVGPLASALTLGGARVWFDDWTIRPGDSIPAAIDDGLQTFDVFVLVWSSNAAESRWVGAERDAAFARVIDNDACRVVPVCLDDAPLPGLLAPIKRIDGRDGDHLRVARELLEIDSDATFRIAVQLFIDEAGIDFQEFPGVGVMVACPKCGAKPNSFEAWEAVNHERDDVYRGVRCTNCGWNEGSEV